MGRKVISIFLFFLARTFNSFAQGDDFGVWVDAAVGKKIASTEIMLLNEFYTCNNSHSIDRVSIGVGASRHLFTFLSLGAGYLLMNKNTEGDYELRHRFYSTANMEWKVRNFSFSFRERFQLTKYPPHEQEKSRVLNHWRNRMRIKYDLLLLKIKPAIGVETFVPLNQSTHMQMDEIRYNLSAFYQLNKLL